MHTHVFKHDPFIKYIPIITVLGLKESSDGLTIWPTACWTSFLSTHSAGSSVQVATSWHMNGPPFTWRSKFENWIHHQKFDECWSKFSEAPFFRNWLKMPTPGILWCLDYAIHQRSATWMKLLGPRDMPILKTPTWRHNFSLGLTLDVESVAATRTGPLSIWLRWCCSSLYKAIQQIWNGTPCFSSKN